MKEGEGDDFMTLWLKQAGFHRLNHLDVIEDSDEDHGYMTNQNEGGERENEVFPRVNINKIK